MLMVLYDLSAVELETLLLFANRGPLTGYDLHSKLKDDGSGMKASTNIMSDPYWLQVRKKLLDLNFIVEFPEKGRRKPYIVGEDGFDYLIQNHLDSIHDFDVFAKYCCGYFPMVFGYWNELKEFGLDSYIISNLGRVVGEVYLDVLRDFALGRRRKFSHREFVEALYVRLYVPELFTDVEGLGLVPEVLYEFRDGRSEIVSFVRQWLVMQKKDLKDILSRLDQVEHTLP